MATQIVGKHLKNGSYGVWGCERQVNVGANHGN